MGKNWHILKPLKHRGFELIESIVSVEVKFTYVYLNFELIILLIPLVWTLNSFGFFDTTKFIFRIKQIWSCNKKIST